MQNLSHALARHAEAQRDRVQAMSLLAQQRHCLRTPQRSAREAVAAT
jgi:hypothetical protein